MIFSSLNVLLNSPNIKYQDYNYLLCPQIIYNQWSLFLINFLSHKIICYDSSNNKTISNENVKALSKIVYFFDEIIKSKSKHSSYEDFNSEATSSVDNSDIELEDRSLYNDSDDNKNKLVNIEIETSATDYYLNINKWILKPAYTQLQQSINDSGIYICKYMDYLSRNQPIFFDKLDIQFFRIQISMELLNEKLLCS